MQPCEATRRRNGAWSDPYPIPGPLVASGESGETLKQFCPHGSPFL
jgi:hypothetical protein